MGTRAFARVDSGRCGELCAATASASKTLGRRFLRPRDAKSVQFGSIRPRSRGALGFKEPVPDLDGPRGQILTRVRQAGPLRLLQKWTDLIHLHGENPDCRPTYPEKLEKTLQQDTVSYKTQKTTRLSAIGSAVTKMPVAPGGGGTTVRRTEFGSSNADSKQTVRVHPA
jgi:hypothetical protein